MTGDVRGLLCSRCNHKVLGAAQESPAILRRAARYLERPVAATDQPVEFLDEEEEALEILAALEEAPTGGLPFVVWRANGYGPERQAQWPVILRLDDFTELLRAAGYGDPS